MAPHPSKGVVRMASLLFLLTFISFIHSNGFFAEAFESDELFVDESEFILEQVSNSDSRGAMAERSYGGGRRERDAPVMSGAGVVDSQVKFDLEHSFGGGGRGFNKGGVFVARIRTSLQGLQKLSRLQLERTKLSQFERAALEDLVASDGYYQVRIPSNVFGSEKYVMASARARCLVGAKMVDHFDLHVDSAGNIIALTYLPLADCLKASNIDKVLSSSWEFNSSAALKFGQTAYKLIPASEEILAARQTSSEPSKPGEEPQKPPEPKTFWQKYWMYIVPAGLIVLNQIIAGAAGDLQPGGGGGGGGGPQRGAGTGGAAARRR